MGASCLEIGVRRSRNHPQRPLNIKGASAIHEPTASPAQYLKQEQPIKAALQLFSLSCVT
jgi:hypothetical protein